MKLLSRRFRTGGRRRRREFFTQCLITLWNSLPQDMMITSTEDIKGGLHKFTEVERSAAISNDERKELSCPDITLPVCRLLWRAGA